MKLRVGVGVDAHRCAPGRKLYLGGVEIPSEFGLEAHSDGDVIIHALIDALLGAANLGDIGRHFPPSDPAYKDIRSVELLKRAVELLREKRCTIQNVDISVMCEEPKLAPFADDMRAVLGCAMQIDEDDISIKGTTLERLGFTGRKEGIAALAIVLLERR